MKMEIRKSTPIEPPRVSSIMTSAFNAYNRRFIRRHFHAVRISKGGLRPQALTRPLVIYLNHASWWDPLVCLLLARAFFPDRTSFAPIDATMLDRYRLFKHLGFFPVEQATTSGARNFLRTARAILTSSANVLWLTPQGRFADVRERPLRFQNGLGALAASESGVTFVPLAIEYSFWTESRPEILLSFGETIIPGAAGLERVEDRSTRFADALEETQDDLAAHSFRRDPREWLLLTQGASGAGSIYDALCWLGARLRGEKFIRAHQPETVS
jgi:1-acyl-sn-glycerol-3-phosphate acyltransferase